MYICMWGCVPLVLRRLAPQTAPFSHLYPSTSLASSLSILSLLPLLVPCSCWVAPPKSVCMHSFQLQFLQLHLHRSHRISLSVISINQSYPSERHYQSPSLNCLFCTRKTDKRVFSNGVLWFFSLLSLNQTLFSLSQSSAQLSSLYFPWNNKR